MKERLLTKEGNGISTVKQTMIIGKGDDHNRSDDNLSVDNNRLLLDGVHAQDSRLRQVDDWCSKQRPEHSTI